LAIQFIKGPTFKSREVKNIFAEILDLQLPVLAFSTKKSFLKL